MSSGINRTEILRRDCLKCNGNGYTTSGGAEEVCTDCEGAGVVTKEVPFKFDGRRSQEEIAEAFGIPVEDYRDNGHNEPSRGGGAGD